MTLVSYSIHEWTDPPQMDTGAPEPFVHWHKGKDKSKDKLWIAYRVFNKIDLEWKGDPADNPTLIEPFAVLRFDGVKYASFDGPSDERHRFHPFRPIGLQLYRFHELKWSPLQDKQTRHWILCFHDETYEISAENAFVVERGIVGSDICSSHQALNVLLDLR